MRFAIDGGVIVVISIKVDQRKSIAQFARSGGILVVTGYNLNQRSISENILDGSVISAKRHNKSQRESTREGPSAVQGRTDLQLLQSIKQAARTGSACIAARQRSLLKRTFETMIMTGTNGDDHWRMILPGSPCVICYLFIRFRNMQGFHYLPGTLSHPTGSAPATTALACVN